MYNFLSSYLTAFFGGVGIEIVVKLMVKSLTGKDDIIPGWEKEENKEIKQLEQLNF